MKRDAKGLRAGGRTGGPGPALGGLGVWVRPEENERLSRGQWRGEDCVLERLLCLQSGRG